MLGFTRILFVCFLFRQQLLHYPAFSLGQLRIAESLPIERQVLLPFRTVAKKRMAAIYWSGSSVSVLQIGMLG